MPRGRAVKPKPKPPERRHKVIYETKTGARRVDIVYATSAEGCLTHVAKRIGFVKVISVEVIA
jgi:hypothetical protein